MSNQHGNGKTLTIQNYDEWRFDMLTQCTEGRHTHYFGVTTDGHLLPLTDSEAHEARLDGVAIELPQTAVLTAKDGE